MEENKIAARVWLRQTFPGLPDRLISPDVTSLSELSHLLTRPVSAEMLADREFRKRSGVTLTSECTDSKGAIVCEMDIIAVGNAYREENYHVLRYGWHGNRFSLHRAGETIIWDEIVAKNCTKIASYYDNPDAYPRLFNTHWSL
jgi:hypothetical protein